jgi:hypothetical protein
MKAAGEAKKRLYSALCKDNGWEFSPMVFDPWGGLHGQGAIVWKQITHAATSGLTQKLRDSEVYALRRSLAVKVATSVATQLEIVQLTSPLIGCEPGTVPFLAGTDLLGNDDWRCD